MPDDSVFSDDEEIVSEAKRKGLIRAEAIEVGRKLGEDEARRRNEPKEWAEDRVRRAKAYAAWEFDGRPLGRGADYRKEFGIAEPTLSVPGVVMGADFKKERK